MKEKCENLVKWLQSSVQEAKMDGLLVGISGGIDSAVVAYLIKRAFPNKSLGVTLPCHNNNTDLEHALTVINGCGIDHLTIDLTNTHTQLLQQINDDLLAAKMDTSGVNSKVVNGNLRARLRMSTLYTLAGNFNYLVTGTDNAAEWYTGYFTKYGDGGVDLAPLLHFTKGEVRQLATELGVPTEIINKKPSAGLWEDQTDEHELGISYDKIDTFLQGGKVSEEELQILQKLHENSKHKRDPIKSPPK